MASKPMHGRLVRFELKGQIHYIARNREPWWQHWKEALAEFERTGQWPDTTHPMRGEWVRATLKSIKAGTFPSDQWQQLKRYNFPTGQAKKPPGAAGTAERLQKLLARLENGGKMNDHDRSYLNTLHVVNKLPDAYRQRLARLEITIK